MNIFIFTLLLMFTAPAWATTYQAKQGDVLRIPAPIQGSNLHVQAFNKSWPIYQKNGQYIAWIGIHLNTKPSTYDIQWTSGNSASVNQVLDKIEVQKGEFRISHITVKKKMSSFDKKAIQRIRADQAAIKKAYKTPVNIHNSWPAMIWPVEGIISTPFAAQRYVNGHARSPHSGLDIAAPLGTPVKAPLAGKVLLVSNMFLNGTLVAIGHGDGLTTVYAHLNKALVKSGDIVQQGDVFAKVGSTGRSTGPHLHWGVHFSGAKVNPKSMLTLNNILQP
ncbi:M23 family metallopeptidase [Ghiorsea bivora]|uniref:M23 family metallopeptidase n=1 Tax=Ghiorsea bivora TaxID=1485545 RepID=UPI000571F1AB|nr:M23 family metallopeptidase [Ghiorsea bivora]